MQIIAENPAILLRARILQASLPGFLRWDISGRALLVSDAPRHAPKEVYCQKISAMDAICFTDQNLLYIDLPESAYLQTLCETFFMPGHWVEPYAPIQSLLSGILSRPLACDGEADIPLLRAAMLSCARGQPHFAQFANALAVRDAAALRSKQTRTLRACAALLAHHLYKVEAVGLPPRAEGTPRGTAPWNPA